MITIDLFELFLAALFAIEQLQDRYARYMFLQVGVDLRNSNSNATVTLRCGELAPE